MANRLCAMRQKFMSGALSEDDRRTFSHHLSTCDACSKEMAFWSEFTPDLLSWKEDINAPEITQGDVYQLLSAVADGKRRSRLPARPVLVAATGAALALALVLGVVFTQNTTPLDNAGTAPQAAPSLAVAPAPITYFETGPEEHLLERLGADTLGLAPSTRVGLQEMASGHSRVELTSGQAAFDVAPRATGHRFFVVTGDYTVEVIGTRFSVASDDLVTLDVVVDEGIVQVEGPGGPWTLEDGQRLTLKNRQPRATIATRSQREHVNRLIGRTLNVAQAPTPTKALTPRKTKRTTPEESAPAKLPERPEEKPLRLGDLKKQLASGDLEGALTVARDFVRANPNDGAGWLFLGDCHRKLSQWNDAVVAYDTAMTRGPLRVKNRAAYQAAIIYQRRLGNHEKAIVLLDGYVRSPSAPASLKATAKLNLAKSLIHTEQRSRARMLLEEVIASEGGTYLEKNAQSLLDTLAR